MPPLTPEMAQYLLQQNIQQWSDNLHVQQKVFEFMVRDAQQGVPLGQAWEAVQGGNLGENLVHQRGQIQAIQQYLTQARAALAQGGSATLNAVRSMGNAGVQIMEQAGTFFVEHKAESGGLVTATGQAINYTVQSSAAAGAEGAAGAGAAGAVGETTVATGAVVGETTVAAGAGAVGETTVAAGAAIGETTVAAGGAAVAETTVAAGGAVVAETTVAAGGAVVAETAAAAGGAALAETAAAAGGAALVETAAVTGTAVAATEAGVGATLAAGGASGSWLGPVGIVVGVVITGIVLGGIYVATQSGSDKPKVVIATSSSSSDTDSSSDSDSSSDTDSSSSDTDSSSDSDSSSSSTLSIPGRYVLTEDKSRFSPGSSDSFDSFGCAGRRLPQEIDVSLPWPGFITLTFTAEPGLPAFDHEGGRIDSNNSFVEDYPDASGTEMQGRFETFGSEIDIVDGQYFTGDCTFFFTGKRQ